MVEGRKYRNGNGGNAEMIESMILGYAEGYIDGRQAVKVSVDHLTHESYMDGYRDGRSDDRKARAGR